MQQFKYFIYRPFNNLMAYTTTCEISTLKYLKPKKGTPFGPSLLVLVMTI